MRGDAAKPEREWRVPIDARPIATSIARGSQIGDMLRDDAYGPSNTRLRDLGLTPDLHEAIANGELTSMGHVVFAEDGGSLRRFSGNLAHVCGWYPAWKPRRNQHWEGIAAFNFLIESECNADVEWMQSEGIGFRFYIPPKWQTYTADVHMRIGGVRHVVEIKRTEDDLRDPEYRLKLAAVAEICRRCGWIFRVVLADEIFANRLHAENCQLFADRRFVHVSPRHIERLERHAIHKGCDTTYGALAAALAPKAIPLGEALIQALTIRGRVEIDLTGRIHHRTPLRIV